MRATLTALAALILPGVAAAQPVTGLYVGAGVGANFMQDETLRENVRSNAFVQSGFGRPTSVPARSFELRQPLSFDTGAVGVVSVGYGFGNGLRAEIEGDYRYNGLSNERGLSNANEQKYGGMANVLYDFNLGLPVTPYIGAGVGLMRIDRPIVSRADKFAYQAILGVAYPIAFVPGLAATFEYRFMGVLNTARTVHQPAELPFFGGGSTTYKFNDDYNHALLLGVRYAFNTPAPPPPAVVPPPVQPAVARTYLVFFDWDRADLTDRARQIVAEAAQASTRVQYTRIEVQGNADSSGTPVYNQRLSLRRAQTVAAELVRNGVPRTAIDIQAFGDTRPLVPTAPGVREPQNRRVAIILR